MRIEADRGSANHWALSFKAVPPVRILVDGQEIKFCLMADDETGEVEFYETDEQGHFLVDLQRNDVATRKLTGRVEIIGELLDHLRPMTSAEAD